jgi:cell division initiation protein
MLTPLEIENKTFNKQMVNGYSVNEVHEFMTSLLADYEKLYKENIEYKDKIEVLNQGIQHYKSIEDTLQNALIVAQGTAETVKQNAKVEADNIVKQAEINATKAVDEIKKQKIETEMQYGETKKQFDVYKAKMESLLISQLELLKEMNKNEDI